MMIDQISLSLIFFAMAIDIILPFILAPMYKGYNHSKMILSELGIWNSPVRKIYNVGLLIEGILFILGSFSLYAQLSGRSVLLSSLLLGCLWVFSTGACIFSFFFPCTDKPNSKSHFAKVHHIASAVGFMALLFVPLITFFIFLKTNQGVLASVSIICFFAALVFFVLFILSDEAKFKGSFLDKAGLWQRITLIFMYLPLLILVLKILE